MGISIRGKKKVNPEDVSFNNDNVELEEIEEFKEVPEVKSQDMSALNEAKKLLNIDSNSVNKTGVVENRLEMSKFVPYFKSTIRENKLSTIGIEWKNDNIHLTVREGSKTYLTKIESSKEYYEQFCLEVLGIDSTEKYNDSKSAIIEGVKCRVYALLGPVAIAPIITMSTTKPIPDFALSDPEARKYISEELLDEIVHSTFVIGGGTGSGKTYTLNALLGHYVKDDERLAIVEEFGELTPPNDVCVSVVTPPVKPGVEPLLRWVTESSNLMRLDGFIVGEIKSSEAYPFVLNASSGIRGCATVHGDSARKVLARLVSLAMLQVDNKTAIQEFVAKSIDYVIVMRKHRVFEIVKVTGSVNNDNFNMAVVYRNDNLLRTGEVAY